MTALRTTALSALAAFAIAGPALATTQIIDGGFETEAAGVSSYCYFSSDCAVSSPWNGAGGGLQDENNGAWPGTATSDGSKYGFVQNTGYIEQTFTANDTGYFTLHWSNAGRPQNNNAGNQTYRVLLNGVSKGQFSTTSFQPFTAVSIANIHLDATQAYTLRFQGLANSYDDTAFIDAVSLTQTGVPEPATWALMLVGFGGLGAMLRRRRSQVALAA